MTSKRKLQEVFAHSAGSGDLLCHPNGSHVYTAGADASIRVFSHDSTFTLLSQLSNHHSLPIRSLALNPFGDSLASSGDDHLVQLFTIPPSTSSAAAQPKFESTVYRSAGTVLSLSFHPSSNWLAMGCADGAVRVLTLLDSAVRELKGHQSAVRCLTYDPSGDLIASIDALGVLQISRPDDRSSLLLEPFCPRMDTTKAACMAKLSFSPDGEYLALPGRRDVTIRAKADAWRRGPEERLLKGGHPQGDVSIVEWSGSGRYVLSASVTRVVVWEADSGEVVSQVDIDTACVSVHWAVSSNAICMMDENGYIKKWDQPVPAHMPPPHTATDGDGDAMEEESGEDGTTAIDSTTLDPFTTTNEDDDDDPQARPTSTASPTDEPGHQRKRLRKAADAAEKADAGQGDGDEEFDDEDMDDFIVDDTGGQYRDTDDDYLSRKARQALTSSAHTQPAFQPSSTPLDPVTERRYLAFNLTGSIVSKREAAFNSLEITFADSAQHKPVRLRDHYGFSMAALGEHGCVMASKWESSAKVSVVFYRAFESWAANSDWTLHLPSPETALCVAVGAKFVAVGTDRQYVRLMSYSGVQLTMWSTRGPIVSMVAHGALLCVVYHAGMPLPSHQALHCHVMDVQGKRTLLDCPLPVSPGSTLTWLGYSDKGLLLSMDSASIVRGLSFEWGGQWVPLLDLSKKGKDVHWPVGLMEDKLMCAVCKSGLKVPNTLNRPVLTAVELHIPFVLTDTHLQEELHSRTDLLYYQSHLHSHLTTNPTTPFAYKPAPREQAALDKLLIPLFQLAVSNDQGHRAVDVASRLSLVKSMEICYTLANQGRRVALAGRVGLLMGARRKEKEEEKEREKGGAISLAGFMQKGEKRAEEERRLRVERLKRDEEALNKRKIEVLDDEDDAGDEGEKELTYNKSGKKRVRTIERSDVLADREEREVEEGKEKEEKERKKAEREKERETEVLVEDEDVVEDPKATADFLNAFKQPKADAKGAKGSKVKAKAKDASDGEEDEDDKEAPAAKKGKDKEEAKAGKAKDGKEKPKAKEGKAKEEKAKAKPKPKTAQKDTKADKLKPKDAEKEKTEGEEREQPEKENKSEKTGESFQQPEAAHKPKSSNPFAKRTFA